MKKAVKMLMIVVIISAFTINASADEAEDYINDFEAVLPDGYENLLTGDTESLIGPEVLLYEIWAAVSDKGTLLVSFFFALVGSVLLMAAAGMCPEKMRGAAQRGVSVAVSLMIGASLASVLAETRQALISANSFFSSLVPLLSAVTLAGGGVKSAAVGASGMNLVLSLVGGVFTAGLSSLTGFSLAMGLASSVGGHGAQTVSKFSKGLFMWIFGIGTALLMGTLSLQTLVSSSSDSAAMRTAKYIAGTGIPMVGGTISSSLSTLAAGLSYAKGVIGGAAVFVLLLMFLTPLLLLLLYRLALWAASLIAELVGISSAVGCFGSFKGALDITLSVYALSSILYIFEIILFIKSGVALL